VNILNDNNLPKKEVFKNWVDDVPPNTIHHFYNSFKLLPKDKNKILEIGTYSGTSVIEFLKCIPNSTATVIDSWESYDEYSHDLNKKTMTDRIKEDKIEELFYKNTFEYRDRITVMKGKSSDKLLELYKKGEKFTFIYVDGSHKCLDVYFDAVLSWNLLEEGGIICFDDYQFNNYDGVSRLESPHDAVEYWWSSAAQHGAERLTEGREYRQFFYRGDRVQTAPAA
jgi:predicted O-methyltransferase YrrM